MSCLGPICQQYCRVISLKMNTVHWIWDNFLQPSSFHTVRRSESRLRTSLGVILLKIIFCWVLMKLPIQVTNPKFCSLRTSYVRHSTVFFCLFSAYPECSVKLKYITIIKKKLLLKAVYTNKNDSGASDILKCSETNFSNTKYNKITFIKYNFSPFTLF